MPIYAFQTDLTDGGVLRGARALVKRAKTTKKQALLVDGEEQQSHLDPLTARAEAQQVPPEPDRVPRRQALSAPVRRR